MIWFACINGFSGQLYVDTLASSCFNLIFTALPILFYAIFDRPYSKTSARLCPELYKADKFNMRLFALYVGHGFVHSIVIFWGVITVANSTLVNDSGAEGQTFDFWACA